MRLDTQRLDPGPDSGVPGRQPTARPAAADPGRGLRVRGRDPGTVRLRPPREGRQGPAPPIPGQGGRPLASAGHPPAAPAPDHGRHRRPPRPPAPLPPRYTKADIGLLAEVDALHGTLSGPATRQLCIRALHVFGDHRFEHLAAISNGHLYNLRHSTSYRRRRGTMPATTRPVHIAIGERRRPRPAATCGSIPSTKATSTASRASTTSTSSTRSPSSSSSAHSSASRRPASPPSSKPCSGRSPSPSADSTPTTVRSSSTARSPPCCRPSTSTSSPSPAPDVATTTPSSRARTARSSASTSDTATSPAGMRSASTPSPSRSSLPT